MQVQSALQQQVTNVLLQARANHDNPDQVHGATTGIARIDKATGGFRYGDLTTIAGRPGMGKSAFAFGAGFDAARAGIETVLVSLEMNYQEVLSRELCRNALIPMERYDQGPSNKELERLDDAGSRIHKLPILITTRVRDIDSIVTLVEDQKPKLLIIDYFQLLYGGADRALVLEKIAYQLHTMAKDKNMAVVAVSQVRREAEERDKSNKRPMLNDLEWGAGLGKASENVWFLYSQAYYETPDGTDTDEPMEMELIVSKARKGRRGALKLSFDGKYMNFSESV